MQAFSQHKRMVFIWSLVPLAILVLLFVGPRADMEGEYLETVEMVGLMMAIICLVGRCWSTLFIGSRKNNALVTRGPYAFSRNPLYVFSTIGAFGVGLMMESLIIGVVAALLCYAIFSYVIAREEPYLENIFGQDYRDYKAAVPRFLPNPVSLFSARPSQEPMTFSPHALRRTFLDGLVFLAVFPLIETIGWLQEHDYITPLIRLW